MSDKSLEKTPGPLPRTCPHCGAEFVGDKPVCWLCMQRLDGSGPVPDPKLRLPLRPDVWRPPPPLPKERPEQFQFSLSTLMLAMTLIAVLFGLCAIAPGLGIPLFVLALPAWIRTARFVQLDEEKQGPMTPGEKILVFMASLCGMVAIGGVAAIVGIVAFMVVCTNMKGSGLFEGPLPTAEAIAIVATLCVLVLGFIMYWPRRKKSRHE